MTRLGPIALCAALVLPPALSRADEDQPFWTQEGWPDASAAEAQPPQEAPPAPQVEGQAPAPAPQGQWVYTQQYGWIWQPYSDAYTQVPASGYGEPLAYVYYPSYGWTWLAAPWIWGVGPWPVFGVWGPARYGWYAHGWWRYPSRWHYAPSYAWGGHRGWAPGYGYGGRVGITRPAPYGRAYGGYGGYARGSAVAPSRAFSGGGRGWGGGAPAWSGGGRGGGGAHVVAPRGGGGGGGHGGGGGGGGHGGGRHR